MSENKSAKHISLPAVKNYAEDLEENNKENTARRYVGDLDYYADWCIENGLESVTQVRAIDAHDYLQHLSKKYSDKTATNRAQLANRLHATLLLKASMIEEPRTERDKRLNKIDENPFNDWMGVLDKEFSISSTKTVQSSVLDNEEDDEVYAPTREVVDKLIQHAPTPNPRNKLLIALQAASGVRVSELIQIELSDFYSDKKYIDIPPIKSDFQRDVPYDSKTIRYLKKYVESGRRETDVNVDEDSDEENDYLFVSSHPDYQHISRGTAADIVKKAAWNVNKSDCDLNPQRVLYVDAKGNNRHLLTSHSLRHHFATDLANAGMPLFLLASLLGHSKTSTTEKYTSRDWDEITKHAEQYLNK